MKNVVVGDRVAAGDGAERDTGVVQEIGLRMARVGWDSGVATWCEIEELEPSEERWAGGVRCE